MPHADRTADYLRTVEGRQALELLTREREVALSGLDGPSLAFFLASTQLDDARPCLVVTATQEEAEELREELETFAGAPALFFPPWESLFAVTSVPDEDICHDRLRVLRQLVIDTDDAPAFVVAPVHAVFQPIPSTAELEASRLRLAVDEELERDALAARLVDAGFRHVPLVMHRGEFSVRGDIVDVFAYDAAAPLRLEFFGDSVESIREYDPETQRSLADGARDGIDVLIPSARSMFVEASDDDRRLLLDLVPDASRIVVVDPEAVEERLHSIGHNLLGDAAAGRFLDRFDEHLEGHRLTRTYALAIPSDEEARRLSLQFGTVERFRSEELAATMQRVSECLAAGSRLTVFCESDAERGRIADILNDHGVERVEALELAVGPVRRGFESRALGWTVLATGELFNRRIARRARRPQAETRVVQSFFDLQEGDLVVHLSHGIGRYLGARQMETEGVAQEYLVIEYRDGVKIYVPASKIDLVQKYIGKGTHVPALDRVGGTSWSRRKESVEQAILDFASELLEVQAIRQEKPGIAYPADNEWQRQLEAAFPYDDTPDQGQATTAVKADLEADRPMDRLLCGDVGYGKTEVAMRAAFKVVNAGRQVVVLVPTTVLAQQHCRTFRERMAGFPVRIEQLSRFCTAKEARDIVEAARQGTIDILIGTHRVLSDDVGFKDIGLVVIDEEQRFGVGHKEKLKRMRATVDILTLTATPIPRTLHMALLGIRDISSLTTPPEGRSPISTDVMEFDRPVVRDAILRELNREGQVYFVHNRIQDIGVVRHQLQQIVPEARIEYAHGQMTEKQLEDIMFRFLERRIDVLVSTTIIETGIDIPNVNTIFINECDRYGLADLHQLRGRVGRSRHRAYCYLILPEHRHVNPDARKRIQSIREFSQLGAGFQIAMRDLEIRGAGNILGAEQSGHIAVVGYDLYCRLLEKAVKQLQGEDLEKAVDVELDLNIAAFIPEEVVPEESSRLEMYRRISSAQRPEELDAIAIEMKDRYGIMLPVVETLFDVQLLRIYAARRGVRSVRHDEESIILGCGERFRPLLDACPLRVVVLDPGHVAIVVNAPLSRRRVKLTDEIVFRSVLEWLRSGTLPTPVGSRAALRRSRVTPDAPASSPAR